MTAKSYCFDLNPGWGTHVSALEFALASLPPGSLVIEHGAGMFSSPLIAQFDVRVICIEEAPHWRAWAEWVYRLAGRQVEVTDRAKTVTGRLSDAELVFIDGAIRERGDLLKWSLDVGVPCVVAHDTEDDERKKYGYRFDRRADYAVEHTAIRPATTTWRKVTPL